MAANTKYAVYKIFNGKDFDTIYFKAPAAAITESNDKQFISKANNDKIIEYLNTFNVADKLVQLEDGKIPSNLINQDFGDYLDKRSTAALQDVNSEVMFNHANGIFVPNGINLNVSSATDANTNSIKTVAGGIKLSVGEDGSNQEITFTKDGSLSFKNATEIKNVKLGADSSAVPKSYVDTVIESGSKPIESVMAATTAPLSTIPSGVTVTLDGVSVSVGERVLIKNQEIKSENGIYIVSTGDWAKVTFDSTLKGALVFVEEGHVNNDSKWYHEADGEWIKFSQTDQLSFHSGLEKIGDEVIVEPEGIDNSHINSEAQIALSKLGNHTGNITNWDTNATAALITSSASLNTRLTDLAMSIYRLRGDVDTAADYGEWNSDSLSIKAVNDVAVAKQNPVRFGTAEPTPSLYNEGDVYLLLDQTT